MTETVDLLDHLLREKENETNSRRTYSRCNPIWVKFIVYAIALLACGLVVLFLFWSSKRDCEHPYITNGMVIGNDAALHRTISLQCNVGYKLWLANKSIENENSYNLTCTREGTWNDIIPECKIVDCETPVPPTNGFIIGSTYTYGHSVLFACSTGYKMWTADGITELKALVLKCNEKGEWTDQFPICKAIECQPIDRGENTRLINYDPPHHYGDVMKYKCFTGYYLESGDLKRTCREDGTWTGCEPVCRRYSSKSSIMNPSHYVVCLTLIVSLINFVKFNFN